MYGYWKQQNGWWDWKMFSVQVFLLILSMI